ncbi:MAG: CHAT domain-containing protein [Bacteroidales bacterium]
MHSRIFPGVWLLAIGTLCLVSCQTASNLVTQEQQAGDAKNNAGEFQQAIDHYQKSLEASMKLGVYRNTEMEAQVCRKVSQAYQTLGKYKDAMVFIGYASTLDSINKNPLRLINDQREKGRILLMQGDLLKGIDELNKSLVMSAGLESSLKDQNRLVNAEVQLALAHAYLVVGRIEEARSFALGAQEIYTAANRLEGQAECQLLLGSIMSDKGAVGRAAQHLEQSIQVAERAGLNTARQYKALSENLLLMGEYEKALRYAIRSKNKADSAGIKPQQVWAQVGIGDVYRLMGDEEKATEIYYQALELTGDGLESNRAMKASVDWRLGNVLEAKEYFGSQESRLALALTLLRIGDIYLKQEQTDSALNNFREAYIAFEKAASKEGMVRSGLFMTRTFLDGGQNQNAAETLDEAAKENKNPDLNWMIYYLQGRYFENTGEKDRAAEAYRKSIEEIENFRSRFSTDELKSSYMNNKMEVYDRLIRLLMEQGDKLEALRYAERGKARAFLDLLGNKKVGLKNNKPSPLIEKEQALSSQILLLKKQYNKSLFDDESVEENRASRAVIGEELTRAQEQYTQLLLEIKLNDPAYHSLVSVEPANIESIQETIDNSEVLLEYWTGAGNTTLWLIRKNDVQAITLPKTATEVNRYVENYRDAIQSISLTTTSLAKRGFEWLLKPVAPLIKKNEVIGIIPHGALHLLPFQALMNEDGKYLAETNILFYAPSASVYYENKKKAPVKGDNLLAMGLGKINIGIFPGLPGTQREVEGISNIWPGIKIAMEKESTEGLLKASASGYQYLHLATHGYFNENQPTYSFLLFSPTEEEDGQLTVNEVFGLSLNTRIVTMSACQTGLGKINAGDELVGLSRAFLYAGSRSVLASLWNVADESTAVLMTDFYTYLRSFNQQEALTMAERQLMKRWPAPYYWAPFQIIGNEVPFEK